MLIDTSTADTKVQELFDELWREYHDLIEKLCAFKLSQPPERAEDVVQRVFLALFTKLQAGDVIEYPKTWLYATASTIIKMEYHEISREKEILERAYQDLKDRTYGGISYMDTIISDETLERLADTAVIERLSQSDGELLLDVYWNRMEIERVAKKHKVSAGAIYKRIERLHKRVYAIVQELLQDF